MCGADLLRYLADPRGRAAKRNAGFEAKTIHRLIEVDPKAAVFGATPTIRSNVTYSLWTNPRWWTCC